jgi:hypothetical protein
MSISILHTRSSEATYCFLIWDAFKQWMFLQVLDHPLVQVFDIRNCVNDTARAQDISVLGQKGGARNKKSED